MSIIDRLFLAHPRSIDENYAEHAVTAFGFGARMAVGGVACMIHAFIPALCADSASRTVGGLERTMRERAATRRPQPGHAMAEHDFAWVI